MNSPLAELQLHILWAAKQPWKHGKATSNQLVPKQSPIIYQCPLIAPFSTAYGPKTQPKYQPTPGLVVLIYGYGSSMKEGSEARRIGPEALSHQDPTKHSSAKQRAKKLRNPAGLGETNGFRFQASQLNVSTISHC